jgi:hypothetical protein
LILEGLVDSLALASGDERILLGDQVVDNRLNGGLQVLDLTLDLDRVGQGDGRGTVDSADTGSDSILNLLGGSEKWRGVRGETLDGSIEAAGDGVDVIYNTNDGSDLTLQDGGRSTRNGEEGKSRG